MKSHDQIRRSALEISSLQFCITQKRCFGACYKAYYNNRKGILNRCGNCWRNSPAVLFIVVPISMIFAIAEGWIRPFPTVTFLVSIMVLWQMSIRRITVPATVIMVCILLQSFHICLIKQRLKESLIKSFLQLIQIALLHVTCKAVWNWHYNGTETRSK